MTSINLRLRASHPPYDGRRLLWFLGLHAVPGVESWDGEVYARALRLAGGPGTVWLRATASGYVGELRLTASTDERPARRQLDHLLDLGGDRRGAEQWLSADELLAPMIAARPGVRAPGSVDHVETLMRTIIGQQISLAGARTVMGRIVALQGLPLPSSLAVRGLTTAFPVAESLAIADPVELPMPRARGRSLIATAMAVAEGGDAWVDGQVDHRQQLLALPGVGPWTADYLALRAGRDPDIFLPTDLAVRRAFEAHGLPAEPVDVAARALNWAPHRSLALMHWWTDLLERRGDGRSGASAPRVVSVPRGTIEP